MNGDTPLAEALPQAGGQSLPGQAAQANPGPPDAQGTIEEALYGTQGAQGLNQLRAVAPGPSQGPPATIPGPSVAAPAPTGGGPDFNKAAVALGTVAAMGKGGPAAGIQAGLSVAQMGLQRQLLQQTLIQRAQTLALNDSSFLDKLKSVPVGNARLAMAADYFGRQGRPTPPAILHMLNDQDVLNRMSGPEIDARIKADPEFAQMYVHAMDKPLAFLTLHNDVQKSGADTERAINEAAASKLAPAEAAARLAGTRLSNQQKQMEIDSFYADMKKAVDVEARKQGLNPGTPEYTDYTNSRTAALEAKQAFEKTTQTNLAKLGSEGLSTAERDKHTQFANIAAFMAGGLKMLEDPKVAKNRGLLEGRLRTLGRELGVSQGNEDIYQTFSNLGSIMSVMQFPGRSRAFQMMQWLREHTAQAGDQLPLVRHRMQIMWALAHDSDALLLQRVPASQMAPVGGPGVRELTEGGRKGAAAALGAQVDAGVMTFDQAQQQLRQLPP